MNFQERERARMIEERDRLFKVAGLGLFAGKPREFVFSEPTTNLWDGVRADVIAYFQRNNIGVGRWSRSNRSYAVLATCLFEPPGDALRKSNRAFMGHLLGNTAYRLSGRFRSRGSECQTFCARDKRRMRAQSFCGARAALRGTRAVSSICDSAQTWDFVGLLLYPASSRNLAQRKVPALSEIFVVPS